MRDAIGCAGILAIVAYLLGLPFSLFFSVNHWSERFLIALMPAVLTFIAAFGLMLRDKSDHDFNRNKVRQTLLTRQQPPASDVAGSPADKNRQLLVDTRKAIAEYFDLPLTRVLATDNLRDDLKIDKLAPALQMYVVDSVVSKHVDIPKPFGFGLKGLSTVADLSKAIGELVDGFDDEKPDR